MDRAYISGGYHGYSAAFIKALIDSVLVSPDPATICEFFTVIAKFNRLPDTAQTEILTQIKDMTFGDLVGHAVFRAFELGFITDATIKVTATKGAETSEDTSQTITVVDEADVLNAIRDTIIAALKNDSDFAEFDVIEELPQTRGFTGPTILLETIANRSEQQGYGQFTIVNTNFHVILMFPDGKHKTVGADTLTQNDLAQHYLGVLAKVLNQVDLSAFDIDEKRISQQTHFSPTPDLKYWGCSAVLSLTYKGICA